ESHVAVRVPQRGALRELAAMAQSNAELGLLQRVEGQEGGAAALPGTRHAPGLPGPPRRVEGYDISTLHGTLTVGSRVVFADGVPDKSGYRRYRIREAPPEDDYACLREVIARRLARARRAPAADRRRQGPARGGERGTRGCGRQRARGLDREGEGRGITFAARAPLGRAQGRARIPAQPQRPDRAAAELARAA